MKLDGITKKFGDKVIIDGCSLDMRENGITCILGPSGCGKTTLLNVIAGLVPADGGSISFGESEVGSISYLFQEPRLLPWRTALQNVALVIPGERKAALEKAAGYLDMVGLGDKADSLPAELSGGMRQRVALARAFAFPSRVMLIDEPFQGLDVAMRKSVTDTFLKLWESDPKTVVWVTHDVDEAVFAADDIVVFASRGLQKKTLRTIDVPRAERTPANMAGIHAEVYQSLV